MSATYLVRRGSVYYFRFQVPADLQNSVDLFCLCKSLKTSDKNSARTIAGKYERETAKIFSLLRASVMSAEEANARIADLFQRKGNGNATGGGLTLSALARRYISDKAAGWAEKTRIETVGVFALLDSLLGNPAAAAISRENIRELRERLLALPPNSTKRRKPRKATAKAGAAAHGATGAGEEAPPVVPVTMSLLTVNKYLGRLSTLLRYGTREGLIPGNPAEGIKLAIRRRPDMERQAYSAADIQKIYSALPHDKSYPERFWVPLLCIYTGARLDEICQLYVADVQTVDDIPCLSIAPGADKKLKTASAERLIPIHPHLLKLGFLDYVKMVKKGGAVRVFPNLKWRKADGYSNAIGKWFQRLNHALIGEKTKCLHSCRHSFINSLKQAEVADTVIKELSGHSHGDDLTNGRYGKRYLPQKLLAAVRLIDYGLEAQNR